MINLEDKFSVRPVNRLFEEELQQKIDSKTKPLGSLGVLEDLVLQIGLVQQTLEPTLNRPSVMVFAGDHGIVAEKVSPYPQEVTQQMVINFLEGGAAINAFTRQHGLDLWVVNSGVSASELSDISHPRCLQCRVGPGTKNFAREAAMTWCEMDDALEKGREIVQARIREGSNILGFGEMGIGNSSAAAAVISLVTGAPVRETVGPGSGCDSEALDHKLKVLEAALMKHRDHDGPLDALRRVGGFEMVMMLGGMLKASQEGALILVDGLIVSSVALVAVKLFPEIEDYLIFCHRSAAPGFKVIEGELGVKPLLDLNMRLGEGSGVAVAFPIIESALAFNKDMATFDGAAVSSAE